MRGKRERGEERYILGSHPKQICFDRHEILALCLNS